MKILNMRVALLTVLTLSMSAMGFAQEEADMRQLRQQAVRLTVLGELPEEARADAEVLLDQGVVFAERAEALRAEGLQAYIAAMEAGEAPMVARELAQQSVAEDRLALMRDLASFRDDVQAFADEYPEARGVLGQLRQGLGRGGMERGGMGRGGMGHGGFGGEGFGGEGFSSEFEPQQGRMGGHQQGMARQQGRRGMNQGAPNGSN
jgi:hypothetical protein